ncbi:MAG: hypothetical protein PGN13_09885 [Patulibacter minatonensis]
MQQVAAEGVAGAAPSLGGWRWSSPARAAVLAARLVVAVGLVAFIAVGAPFMSGPVAWLLLAILWRVEIKPGAANTNVASWTKPRRFALHCGEGRFVLVGVIAAVIIEYAVTTLAGGTPAGIEGTLLRVGLQDLIPGVLLVGAYEATVWRRGGWARIDPVARDLSWQRRSVHAGPTQHWSFDEITATRVHRTTFGAVLVVRVGDDELRVRVPSSGAWILAESLARASSGQLAATPAV